MKNLAWLTIFNTISWWFSTVAYFLGYPVLEVCKLRVSFKIRSLSLLPGNFRYAYSLTDLDDRWPIAWNLINGTVGITYPPTHPAYNQFLFGNLATSFFNLSLKIVFTYIHCVYAVRLTPACWRSQLLEVKFFLSVNNTQSGDCCPWRDNSVGRQEPL